MNAPVIIAMWSGPRNLSTALMRSFAQRSDTLAWDEPFYAAYLKATGLHHPMRDEVIANGISDPQEIAARCLEAPKPPKTVFYQKHMTHHMIGGFPLGWADKVTNAFLLRAPERVLASYAKKRESVAVQDIGFSMQRRLFEQVADHTGRIPIVIDSEDIRRSPETALRALCDAIGIGFDPAMLSWKKGPALEDGIWGSHWYDAIRKSTGFAPPEKDLPELDDELTAIAEAVRPDYEFLREHKLDIG